MLKKILFVLAVATVVVLTYLSVKQYQEFRVQRLHNQSQEVNQQTKVIEEANTKIKQLDAACKRGETAYQNLTAAQKAKLPAPQCSGIVQ